MAWARASGAWRFPWAKAAEQSKAVASRVQRSRFTADSPGKDGGASTVRPGWANCCPEKPPVGVFSPQPASSGRMERGSGIRCAPGCGSRVAKRQREVFVTPSATGSLAPSAHTLGRALGTPAARRYVPRGKAPAASERSGRGHRGAGMTYNPPVTSPALATDEDHLATEEDPLVAIPIAVDPRLPVLRSLGIEADPLEDPSGMPAGADDPITP